MTKRLAAFRLDPAILGGLEALRVRDGVPKTESVNRALRQYLKGKRIALPTKTGKAKR